MRQRFNFFGIIALIMLVISGSVSFAQFGYGFGQNKVQYKDFDWSILSTEHFDVYYYSEEKQAAFDAARMAERGYAYLSEVLKHKIERKIPLILYASLNDFQQTNVIGGILGDGTRGVTESLKSRVVMPITGSYREFNHVLIHELVHAFQFDIMFGRKSGVTSTRFNPPLWFVEGMAEYLSNGMDNTTRMWVRDALNKDELPDIDEMNALYDIRVYRIGQAAWYYIGETYGKKKIGDILKSAVATADIKGAFQTSLHLDDSTFASLWKENMQELVLNDSIAFENADSTSAKITSREGYFHSMNIVPTISPDGKKIAYVANKNLADEIYLLTEIETGEYKSDLLLKGGQSNSFESLRFFSSTMNWSKDSKKLLFVTKSGKEDIIYIMDVDKQTIIDEISFDELNGLESPSFSPDGSEIAFTGMRGGQSDLYLFNLKSRQLTCVTADRLAVIHPQWSPKGDQIAFVTDRGRGTNEDELLFGDYDLAIYDLKNNSITMLTDLKGNVINPQWSAYATEIAFISDHQGVPNIYRLDLSNGNLESISNIQNGVGGITEVTPAFSWSENGEVVVFSTFQDLSWQLYKMEEQDVKLIPIAEENGTEIYNSDSNVFTDDDLWLPELDEPNELYSQYHLGEADSVQEKEYSTSLQLDGALLGASLGGFFGSVGGGQIFFSDMLSNQFLGISAGLRFDDFARSDLGVTYFNQTGRINYGAQLYQVGNAFGSVFTSFDEISFIRQVYRGGNLFAAYPFSRFTRLELSTGLTNVDQDVVISRFNGRDFDTDTEDLRNLTFGQFGAAVVYDNTTYGPLGPFHGTRFRINADHATGGLNFTTYYADYRRYFNIGQRTVLSYRLMGGASTGPDEQFFRIGGPFTYRGSDYGELIGSRFLIQNIEYRFPLLPFLPPNADFLSGFAFIDAAAAWGIDIPGFSKNTFQPFTTDSGFQLNDLRAAPGIGIRFNLGFMALQYHIAWPTDLQSFSKPFNQFSIGTFF
jgi:Tol biopolymer transport system component